MICLTATLQHIMTWAALHSTVVLLLAALFVLLYFVQSISFQFYYCIIVVSIHADVLRPFMASTLRHMQSSSRKNVVRPLMSEDGASRKGESQWKRLYE